MWTSWTLTTLSLWILFTTGKTYTDVEIEDPDLYYYGLEESERSLPQCATRQACAALWLRYWRNPALIRLCRCKRRARCDTPRAPAYRMPINNRAYFQFCQPVAGWLQCKIDETPLVVDTAYDRMNPDELEELHHNDTSLTPPKIVFRCRCPEPNYWKINDTVESDVTQYYQCSSLPPCRTDEYCGNVSYDLNALYQSCSCPKRHICVQDGGLAHQMISELLYRGKGWNAYCRRTDNYSYEDYST